MHPSVESMNIGDLASGLLMRDSDAATLVDLMIHRGAGMRECAKSMRVAAVVDSLTRRRVIEVNGPPQGFLCAGDDACRAVCSKVAVHAEERAVHSAARWGMINSDACELRTLHVIHLKVVDGAPVTSGPPSCVTCSRTMLDAGIAFVWLWHADGWRRYPADAFHAETLHTLGLPLVRSR